MARDGNEEEGDQAPFAPSHWRLGSMLLMVFSSFFFLVPFEHSSDYQQAFWSVHEPKTNESTQPQQHQPIFPACNSRTGDSVNGELMPTSSSNIVGGANVVVVASHQGISLPQTRESISDIVADTNLARVLALKHDPEVAGEGDNVAAEEDQVQSSDVVADSNVARIVNVKQRAEVAAEAAEMRSPDIVVDTNLVRVVDPKQGDKVAAERGRVQNSGIVADTNLAKTVDAKQEAEVVAEAADQVESAVVEADTHLKVFVASGVSGDNGTTGASEIDKKNQVLCSTVTTGTSNVRHVQFAIREGREKSRGVNLGGWLVAEHWMTKNSEIWWGISDEDADCGEYTTMTKTTRKMATRRAKAHRDRFITEADVQKIASAGLNTVRVPVGFWIVGFDDHDPSNQKQWQMYAPHGLDYLDKLIRDWAKKHNVAVLISMHAAKGSQNGADHSSPQVKGQSYWAAYPENIASTLDAVRFLASRYKNDDAFLGIGLLNEPGGSTSMTQLYKYYEDAYRLIRVEDQNDCVLAISPLLWEQSPDHMTELLPYAKNVWVEWHRYFVWGYEDTSEDDLLTKSIPAFRDDVERWKTKSDKKIFIGEFSFATSKAQFNDFNNKSRVREFAQAQMDVLEQSVDGGWTFWTWRIDGDDKPNELSRWSLRNMIENEIFPSLSKGYV